MNRPAVALLALTVTLPLLGACQTAPDGTEPQALLPADADPGTYWQGDRSQAYERAYVVARNPQEWNDLWARVGEAAPGPLPGDRMAAAVFLGPRDTGGYGVSIVSARAAGGDVVVGYRERVPGPAQAVAQMQTSPYAVRLIPMAAGAAKFQREK
ncbi:protease complex subunit PrcB family protein [Azospirillum argentinense]|uniref:Protease complex subunit PrcB family protein n=1 Tax=Azospirillum brasilense TaxID=192 RepID=A0A4D8Q3W8_AZOBR|nr:protease complex subunit PrcB family protein [Azospirillum argentinense]QCO02259.1 protease complex subunit PrcB family protein [Azospirillum argentinense]